MSQEQKLYTKFVVSINTNLIKIIFIVNSLKNINTQNKTQTYE